MKILKIVLTSFGPQPTHRGSRRRSVTLRRTTAEVVPRTVHRRRNTRTHRLVDIYIGRVKPGGRRDQQVVIRVSSSIH